MPALPIREIIRLRYHLDIPGFIQAAIRYKLDKEKVLIYLEIIVTSTRDAIKKMGHFGGNRQARGPHPQRDTRLAPPLLWRTARPGASQPETRHPV